MALLSLYHVTFYDANSIGASGEEGAAGRSASWIIIININNNNNNNDNNSNNNNNNKQ